MSSFYTLIPKNRIHLNAGLDSAVRDALVAYSSPKACTISGFLVGAISTAVALPLLLYYHACYLIPRSLVLRAYSGAAGTVDIGASCNIQALTNQATLLLVLPYGLGLLAALFGYWRHLEVRGELHYQWRFPFKLHQTLAISTGYLTYLAVCLINRTLLPITAAPLLAVAAGPAMWGLWEFIQNRLLYYMSKPTWESLIACTVAIWFQRRIGITTDDIIAVKATPDGLLELHTHFTPEEAEQARLLGPMMPGISRVEVCDPHGVKIVSVAPQSQLTSTLEAGRMVAEIRRQRAGMFAAEHYQPRPVQIDDVSVRMLKVTAIAVLFIFMTTMFWVASRGGFNRLTAEDLMWFFGKYGHETSPILRMPGLPE